MCVFILTVFYKDSEAAVTPMMLVSGGWPLCCGCSAVVEGYSQQQWQSSVLVHSPARLGETYHPQPGLGGGMGVSFYFKEVRSFNPNLATTCGEEKLSWHRLAGLDDVNSYEQCNAWKMVLHLQCGVTHCYHFTTSFGPESKGARDCAEAEGRRSEATSKAASVVEWLFMQRKSLFYYSLYDR